MLQIVIQWVVHSVINLIEQTQATDLPAVPKQQSSQSHNLSALRITLSSEPMRLRRRHPHESTILKAGQNICIETA